MLKSVSRDMPLKRQTLRVAQPPVARPRAKPTGRTRHAHQIITLDTLNAVSAELADFDEIDFAGFDEPREPEKWY
jgi:hypothetical protein